MFTFYSLLENVLEKNSLKEVYSQEISKLK